MEIQEIKHKMDKITSGKTKSPVIYLTPRNNKTFTNTKLSGKSSYTKH